MIPLKTSHLSELPSVRLKMDERIIDSLLTDGGFDVASHSDILAI